MEFRKANAEEADQLTELALKSKAHWGYDKSFIEACRKALTVTQECILSNHVYILEDDSEIIGFYCLIAKGQAGELDSLFIDPQHIGKGYGRILWNNIIQKAKEAGIKEFTIDADPYAEDFYKKMGAIRIGEADSTVIKGRKLPLMNVIVS